MDLNSQNGKRPDIASRLAERVSTDNRAGRVGVHLFPLTKGDGIIHQSEKKGKVLRQTTTYGIAVGGKPQHIV